MKFTILVVLFLLMACSNPTDLKEIVKPELVKVEGLKAVVQAKTQVKSEEEIALDKAKEEQEWKDARVAIAKLTADDVEVLGIQATVDNVRRHEAAAKLTDHERELLGVEE